MNIDKVSPLNLMDTLFHIFSHIPTKDWFNTQLVCKFWKVTGRKIFKPTDSHFENAIKHHKYERVEFMCKTYEMDAARFLKYTVESKSMAMSIISKSIDITLEDVKNYMVSVYNKEMEAFTPEYRVSYPKKYFPIKESDDGIDYIKFLKLAREIPDREWSPEFVLNHPRIFPLLDTKKLCDAITFTVYKGDHSNRIFMRLLDSLLERGCYKIEDKTFAFLVLSTLTDMYCRTLCSDSYAIYFNVCMHALRCLKYFGGDGGGGVNIGDDTILYNIMIQVLQSKEWIGAEIIDYCLNNYKEMILGSTTDCINLLLVVFESGYGYEPTESGNLIINDKDIGVEKFRLSKFVNSELTDWTSLRGLIAYESIFRQLNDKSIRYVLIHDDELSVKELLKAIRSSKHGEKYPEIIVNLKRLTEEREFDLRNLKSYVKKRKESKEKTKKGKSARIE